MIFWKLLIKDVYVLLIYFLERGRLFFKNFWLDKLGKWRCYFFKIRIRGIRIDLGGVREFSFGYVKFEVFVKFLGSNVKLVVEMRVLR